MGLGIRGIYVNSSIVGKRALVRTNPLVEGLFILIGLTLLNRGLLCYFKSRLI